MLHAVCLPEQVHGTELEVSPQPEAVVVLWLENPSQDGVLVGVETISSA